jgi:flagellar basal body-associated protein FliL
MVALLVLVLPVVIIAIAIVVAVYYFSRKPRKTAGKTGKTTKLVESYIREKSEQRAHVNKEIAKLDIMLQNKQIDKDTYERMKDLLEKKYEKKPGQTEELLEYIKNKK